MNLKLILALVLAGLVVLFVIQNAGAVELRFLFWRLAMSQALLVFLVFAAGILLGWLLYGLAAHRRAARRREQAAGGESKAGE